MHVKLLVLDKNLKDYTELPIFDTYQHENQFHIQFYINDVFYEIQASLEEQFVKGQKAAQL